MTRLSFRYNHRHRLLDDPVVRFTKALNLIVVGTDPDRGEVRTFRIDRIEGKIAHVPGPRQAG